MLLMSTTTTSLLLMQYQHAWIDKHDNGSGVVTHMKNTRKKKTKKKQCERMCMLVRKELPATPRPFRFVSPAWQRRRRPSFRLFPPWCLALTAGPTVTRCCPLRKSKSCSRRPETCTTAMVRITESLTLSLTVYLLQTVIVSIGWIISKPVTALHFDLLILRIITY